MAKAAEVYFEEHKESADLGRRALRGGTVSVAMQYGNGVLQIIAAIILARLLAPEDFGLVAIVTVLTSFAPALIDFGLGDATTQSRTISPGQVSSLFWITVGVGSAVALLVIISSPLIAMIYKQPQLEAIALYSSVTFVLWGISNQHLALLRRAMEFGKIAKIQLGATLVGTLIAIIVAFRGYGYWALVVRPIATASYAAIGAWLVCKWRPGFPSFDDKVKSMIRFGLQVVGFSATYNFSRAIDRIGLGLIYQPDQVGYYQNATNLYEYSIFGPLLQLHTVGSAALSKLQSSPATLKQHYISAVSTLSYFVMPTAAILSVTGYDLTVFLLGEKWKEAGSLLSILALRGIFQVIETSSGWLHLAIGRADRWRNWGIVAAAVQIVLVLAGLPFGPEGVAVAAVATSLVIALPSIGYAGRPIGIGAADVIRAVLPQLIAAICTAACGWLLETWLLAEYAGLVRALISGSFSACIYLLIILGLFRNTEPIKIAASIAIDFFKNR
jgi:O-antigen/teichoic acid export membrane protein